MDGRLLFWEIQQVRFIKLTLSIFTPNTGFDILNENAFWFGSIQIRAVYNVIDSTMAYLKQL